MSISVKWTMFLPEDPFSSIASDHETLLPAWAALIYNADATANDIVEDFFRHERELWIEWFGDDASAVVILHITSPESIAGFYEVSVGHPPKASSVKILDPRK